MKFKRLNNFSKIKKCRKSLIVGVKFSLRTEEAAGVGSDGRRDLARYADLMLLLEGKGKYVN